MDDNFYDMILKLNEAKELKNIVAMNDKTNLFGLALSGQEAKQLILARNESLKKYHRIEFDKSILEPLIFQFCDSSFIQQDNYLETLSRLQSLFYLFKNESLDRLTDEEVLNFMHEQFETVCFGDVDYLESTCLPRFTAAVRAGYKGHEASNGLSEYSRVDEEKRWDHELYMQVLKELFW